MLITCLCEKFLAKLKLLNFKQIVSKYKSSHNIQAAGLKKSAAFLFILFAAIGLLFGISGSIGIN